MRKHSKGHKAHGQPMDRSSRTRTQAPRQDEDNHVINADGDWNNTDMVTEEAMKVSDNSSLGATMKPGVFTSLEPLNATTVFDDNLTLPTVDNGNATTNGTVSVGAFLLTNLQIPMWGALAAAAGVLLLCLGLCIVCYIRSCCCRPKKKKKTVTKFTEKDPLMILAEKPAINDDQGSHTSEVMSLGKLQYTLDYDMVKQELSVGVIQASDVPAMDDSGTSDPYVKVMLLPDTKKKFKTKICSKTLNPVFNEFFKFQVDFTELKDRGLRLFIYDHDRFSKDDMIGQVQVPFEDLDFTSTIEVWGDIVDPEKDDELNTNLGDICFTLQYIPSTGKLSVIIIECKNLPKTEDMELLNPYVKIELVRNRKRVKKMKTSKREGTINPYFNEAFVFDVMPDQLYLTTIIISVLHRGGVGKRLTLIGQVEMNNNSQGSEYRHWSEMLRNPRRPVPSWHTLHDEYEK